MEFEALSPDNSMALFYAYLLLTETKIAEGGITTGGTRWEREGNPYRYRE